MPSHFSPEERALLERYVTDVDEDIFAIRDLAGMTGAIYARYSRAPGGFRDTLLKEFIKEGNLDASKANDLIQRVLIAYGDDSVCELEPAHVSFENISILATKELEDRRIGGSPIEQSTRYVFYDQKDAEGNFRYYRDPEIMASAHGQAYVETMDFIFSTYCRLIEPLQAFYRGKKTLEESEYDINGDGQKERYGELTSDKERRAFERTYAADIRTKSCDTLRCLLPVSTKTNVGIMGNGRFFQWALSHCYTSPLAEARDIAARAHAQLDKLMPLYVKRAAPNAYAKGVHERMAALAAELFQGISPAKADIADLLGRGHRHIAEACAQAPGDAEALRQAMQDEEDNLTIATMLYPHLRHPLRQIRETVRAFSPETKERIIATYVGPRASRRDRPGRAFETGYPYTFDFLTDFGTYKDLMRHRMSTQLRQQFTPTLGFSMPADLEEAGFSADAQACADRATSLFNLLAPEFPHAASYATLHGSLVRWVMGLNDRAAMHLIELRTTPQGHPLYRKVAQIMHGKIMARSQWRGRAMQFVDHNDYAWARGDAEAKQRVKENALQEA